MELWFGKEHRGKSFSQYEHIDEVDREMRRLKPPAFIPRAPRGIHQRNKWKGRVFLNKKKRKKKRKKEKGKRKEIGPPAI